MKKTSNVVALATDQVTNGGEDMLDERLPYVIEVTIQGVSPLLFHRWNVQAVEVKANAAKGSTAKKSDDIESYLYRDEDGNICVPGEYLRQAIISAAKFKQDPRSPRKSAMDLFKAAVISLTPLASLRTSKPDFLDKRRVMVQRNGITRTRPAMNTGWTTTIQLMVNLPEYVSPPLLQQVLADAGRLIGIGDFRPTYGRFTVSRWEIPED